MKKFKKKQIISFTALLLSLLIVAYGLEVSRHAWKALQLSDESQAFSFENPDADRRILVVGDSTAVGTGAEDPSLSVAGRFHTDFPEAEIVNLAQNGAKTEDAVEQIRSAEGDFDLVIIHSGANDALYFTQLQSLLPAMRELLVHAKEIGDVVVLITFGDIGSLPVFNPPLSTIYSYRSAEILPRLSKLATELGVLYVNLYDVTEEDLPVPDFRRYAAPDLLHLNGDGYGVWYKLIRETMKESGIQTL